MQLSDKVYELQADNLAIHAVGVATLLTTQVESQATQFTGVKLVIPIVSAHVLLRQ